MKNEIRYEEKAKLNQMRRKAEQNQMRRKG
jgi:hypothetical protein